MSLSPFYSPLLSLILVFLLLIGSIVMEDNVSMFEKSKSPRSQTRLQRQAPAALHLERAPENPLLQQSCATTAIPLLSPLFVSSIVHPSLPKEGDDFRFTEKNGSQPSMDHKEGWQCLSEADHSNQKALLNKFQTKFVLVDHSE